MKKTNTIINIISSIAAIMVFLACKGPDDQFGQNISVDPAKYFDFSTVYGCPIEINYDRQTLINV